MHTILERCFAQEGDIKGLIPSAPEGEGCALLGSSGRLEVAVNRGNASRVLGASRGAPVRVRLVAFEG